MSSPASKRSHWLAPVRLIARVTSGLSRIAVLGLAIIGIMLLGPSAVIVADWIALHQFGASSGLRPFLWEDFEAPAPPCVAAACGMATLPLQAKRQVGGAGGVIVSARILWPAPLVIDASPNTYLQAVGAEDMFYPLVQRADNDAPVDASSTAAEPLLLANEVDSDGNTRPIVVPSEGLVSAWALADDPPDQLTQWARPPSVSSNTFSVKEEQEHRQEWRALKMRTIRFQPVPSEIELDVLRSALPGPVEVGHEMVLDWQKDGVLSGDRDRPWPSHSMLGAVTQIRELGQYLRIKVQIPRKVSQGNQHWLRSRLEGAAVFQGSPVLPNEVRAMFFKPNELLGATPDWGQLEGALQQLPEAETLRAPMAALDPACAEPRHPSNSCVWLALDGVAVPVQVSVEPLPGNIIGLSERAIFAGKALRSTDWAAMPRMFRRNYGSPSRPLLNSSTQALLVPQPWLKAGLPVSVASQTENSPR